MEAITLSELKPIRNQIVFEFIEETRNGQFDLVTPSGVMIRQTSEKQIDYCRWGRILAIGPEVNELEEGQIVLIEKLRWTSRFRITDKKYWITTDEEVLAIWGDHNNLPS